MNVRLLSIGMVAGVVHCLAHSAVAQTSAGEIALKPASAFVEVGDERARSVALFT
jgi:hypothetical protein